MTSRRDRLAILTVAQVVAWAAIAIPQALHRSPDSVDAGLDTQAASQEFAQVSDAPDRDRQAVRPRVGLQRFPQERQRGRIEFGRPSPAGLIGESAFTMLPEPRPPRSHPMRRGLE